MSVLILHHRGPLEATRYDQWIPDYDGEVILLCAEDTLPVPPDSGYDHVEVIDGYAASGHVERRVIELARERGVERVIACQERDMDRAAQLRDVLGLPGQGFASVRPFRDKILMKERVAGTGVPVAEYAAVECPVDVLDFAERHGFPVVVKPRDGAGSFGVRILRSPSDVDEFVRGWTSPPGTQSNLMVERFVSDYMCHVDGLVVDGHLVYAWPSRYMYALAAFQGDLSARMDVTLNEDDPLTDRLLRLADTVLDRMPCPRDFTFHAEIFHTPDDELVLGEIACRTGGAAQRDVQRTLFGLDPSECWVRAQLGLPLPFEVGAPRLKPTVLTGQLGLLKRPGAVVRAPGEPPFPWVTSTKVFVSAGEVMQPAAFAADFMGLFVVSAPNREESIRRMRQLEHWFLDELVLA
jgi:biotin carboxylase